MAIRDGEGPVDNAKYGAMNREEVEEEEQDKPQLATCFVFFRVHNIIAVLSLSSLAVAQCLPSPHDGGILFLNTLLRVYIFVGCIIGLATELDGSAVPVANMCTSMESWVVRGIVYIFLGLIATEESTVSLKNIDGAGHFLSLVSTQDFPTVPFPNILLESLYQ